MVVSLLEDSQGRLCVVTVGFASGLDLLDRATGVFTHHRHDPDDLRSLSHNSVFALYEDRDSTIWAGTRNGLNRYDDKTATFTSYPPGRVVTVLFEDVKVSM